VKLKKTIFWLHLYIGLTVGLVILALSVSGTLLTYERQVVEWADHLPITIGQSERSPLRVDQITAIANQSEAPLKTVEVKFLQEAGTPITVYMEERHSLLMNPYSGEILRRGDSVAAQVFDSITRFHRWFALTDKALDTGQMIIALSNLAFFLLIISGIYLWLPPLWRQSVLKTKLIFNFKTKSTRARYYNWHQVAGFWLLLPLMIISLTAMVFYFPWANDAVYAVYGESADQHLHSAPDEIRDRPALLKKVAVTQQSLLEHAIKHASSKGVDDWYSLWMQIPESSTDTIDFYFDRSIGGQPTKAYELTLSNNGSVMSWKSFSDKTPGDQARVYIRYLHTGEIYGFLGQTIAGIASLAACLLVFTGLMLAWRRLFTAKKRAINPSFLSNGNK